MTTRVGIVNVTGYAGSELVRLLHGHPETELVSVTGRSAAGQKLSDVFPHLACSDMLIEEELSGSLDLVFLGLPHKASAEIATPLLEQGIKVIDLSADFRLKNLDEYEYWYETKHPCPEYLKLSVYGLTELHRSEIGNARLIGNPGCYPTAAILGLYPAVKEGIIGPDLIIDAKSGVSGAGRSANLGTQFSEINENFFAYSVKGHRHFPEIVQELSLSTERLTPTFLTHLVPMTRGIMVTSYANIREGMLGSTKVVAERIREIYRGFYDNQPFVRMVYKPPQTKETWGNNHCLVYTTVDERTNRLIVISCIDNLMKGAAGQAVQNMNLMQGYPEVMGLETLAVYP